MSIRNKLFISSAEDISAKKYIIHVNVLTIEYSYSNQCLVLPAIKEKKLKT